MCIFAKLANLKKTKSNSNTSSGYLGFVKNGFEMVFGKIDMINIISFHFAIVALIVLMVGWNLAENKGFVNVVGDSYSEWLGIMVDAMLLYFINWAIRREEKDKLINQFASESNSFALDATKRLRKKGWLMDGRLNGIDMTHAQLDKANLSKAALHETDFSYASMKESNLVGADFSNSNLTGTDLSNSECRWVNFENANLRWANLEGATLDGVNFEGADLRFARLGEINESTVSLEGALLSQNLTEEEIALVQGSVKNIRASMEEFTTDFYRELFSVNPMVEKLFISNIKSQVIKFAQVFELLVTSLDAIEKFKQKKQLQSTEQKTMTSPAEEPASKSNRIALATKESIEYVLPKDIILCSSESNYTMIYLEGGRKKLISRTLKDVEQWLQGHGFYRAHNSHLVNLSHIKEYVRTEGGYLLLSDGRTLPVARNRKEEELNLL